MSLYSPLLQAFLFITFFTSAIAQNKTPTGSLALFKEVKKQYEAYEKKHGHYIQTPNVKMHYLKWENPGGVPLIWSHGTYSSSYDLLPFAEKLLEMGFEVYAIDYYGHGRTPPPSKEVSHYHIADDINYLMTELGIEKAVIGGWSRGGTISSLFYDQYPDKVLGLILEDGGSVNFKAVYEQFSDEEMTAFMESGGGSRNHTEILFKSMLEAHKYYVDSVMNNWLNFDKSFISDFQINVMSQNQIKKTENGSWGINHGLSIFLGESDDRIPLFRDDIYKPSASPYFGQTAWTIPKAIFRNLHVPMLIFDPVKEGEIWAFEEHNRELKRMHPKLVYHKIYENTGHDVKYQHPERFLADVKEFLKVLKSHHGLK